MPHELSPILQEIYDSNPEAWPYGLGAEMFDEIYPIQHEGVNAGFTAWQRRRDPDTGNRVGFYAVGVVPAHQRKGLAHTALRKMIDEKPADIDEVRAFIVPQNKPSLGLAGKLGVKVTHTPMLSALHDIEPGTKLSNVMPRFDLAPRSHQGLALHSYMPVFPRRAKLTGREMDAIEEGKDQWFGRIFPAQSDSPAMDMSSPGKGALIGALMGALAGGGGAAALGASPAGTAGAGALGATAGGLINYFRRQSNNEDIVEKMRRIPPGGTRRDLLADPVLQADLDRAAMVAAAAFRGKYAAVKQAISLGGLGKGLVRVFNHPAVGVPLTTATGIEALTTPPSEWLSTEHADTRAQNFLLNYAMTNLGVLGARQLAGAGVKVPKVTASQGTKTFAAQTKRYDAAMDSRRDAMNGANWMGAVAAAPTLFVKDLIRTNLTAPKDIAASLGQMAGDLKNLKSEPQVVQPVAPNSMQTLGKLISDHPVASGLAGAGAIAGTGYLASKILNALQSRRTSEAGGRMRVTLPTKKPGDVETTLDLPISEMPLSATMFSKLRRDVRNRLHTETKERTKVVHLSPEEKARRAELLRKFRERNTHLLA